MSTATETAAPVPLGQGASDAPAPAIAAPSTADRLAAAQQAHANAIANHQGAKQRADLAATAHRQAVADRQALLDRAAAGEPVNTTDLGRAGTAATAARDALDLADSIARGIGTLAERAHIAFLQANADHVRAAYDNAVADRLSAAEAADTAKAAYETAIADFNAASFAVSIAVNGIDQHNQTVAAAMSADPTLRALEPAYRPTARAPAHVPMSTVAIPPLILAAYKTPEAQPVSIAAFVRGQHGIVERPAGPQPREESWIERQARERAWADAHTGKAPGITPTDGPFLRSRSAR
jgi:hypothetical protein